MLYKFVRLLEKVEEYLRAVDGVGVREGVVVVPGAVLLVVVTGNVIKND